MDRPQMDQPQVTGRDKRAWVTPVLERMGLERTLGGLLNNPSEMMSGNPQAAGHPGS